MRIKATLASAKQAPLAAVQEMMRHEDIKTAKRLASYPLLIAGSHHSVARSCSWITKMRALVAASVARMDTVHIPKKKTGSWD